VQGLATGFLRRHRTLDCDRAAKLIEQMEDNGIVGPANHAGKPQVLTGGRRGR